MAGPVVLAKSAGGLIAPACLLGIMIVLGGGGSPAPVAEAVAEFTALLVLAIAVERGLRPLSPLRADPRWALLVIAIGAFPLVQILPMPPSLWRQLPGREGVADAMTAAGQGGRWMSWSMLPDAGIAAMLSVLPALALASMVAELPLARRTQLIGVLATLGGAASLLGGVQFIAGYDRIYSFYAEIHRGWGIGFFASRNAQADLVAVTLLAVVLLADRYRSRLVTRAARAGVACVVLLLLLMGIATGSRMGMGVLAIPMLLAIGLIGRRAPIAAMLLGGAAAVLLVGGTALDRVTARVHDTGNRLEIWGDSLVVARSVTPMGAGMGSFVPLYAAAERLDHVQPTIANRAHNDYLELAIEGGLPALALLAVTLLFVGRRSWAGWRDADPDRRLQARFAGLTALIFATHSIVDYPLRNLTLMSVAGLAIGVLAFAPYNRPQGLGDQRLGGRVHA